MNKTFITSVLLGSLMLLSSGAAKIITPTNLLADSNPRPKLESAIPAEFDGWKEEKSRTAQIINPQTEELLNKIYSQTLSRTYVDPAGERVMLSVAYGTDQRRGNEVHYPESCYPAQGFQVISMHADTLSTPKGPIAVNRLETNLANQRFEPVTYWTTIGNEITPGGTDKRMKEIAYGLKGDIPDGLVFRVSSIDTDTPRAFALQDRFVNALVKVLQPADKTWLMGLH